MAVEDTCDFTSLVLDFGHRYLLQKRGEVFLLLLTTLGIIGLGDLKDPQSSAVRKLNKYFGDVKERLG